MDKWEVFTKRKVVKIEQFENEIKNWEFPLVIKPGDDLPTAGGYGVMICYHDADLQKAITRIKEATAETNSLIIEQKIEEKRIIAFSLHTRNR